MFNMFRAYLWSVVLFASLTGWLLPAKGQAAYVDLMLTASLIRFSEDILYVGDTVRIYATIKNLGDTDSLAQVLFYRSDTLIGESQAISVLAGSADDVYVDYTLIEGSFNIRAVIQGADPADQNPSNDEAITPLFTTISDADLDGLVDAQDNCSEVANVDQANFDNDDQGDACDVDIDDDGAVNDDDEFPYDPTVSVSQPSVEQVIEPVVQPLVAIVSPPVNSITAPPTEVQPELETTVVLDQAMTTEPVDNNKSMLIFGKTTAITSPAARFTYRQLDWRTYEFVAIPAVGGESDTFAWDFGDGATSVQPTISHTFPSHGLYAVTLATVSSDGTVNTDVQQLAVSFFHLANPMLLLTLGILASILCGLIILIVRLRRGVEV